MNDLYREYYEDFHDGLRFLIAHVRPQKLAEGKRSLAAADPQLRLTRLIEGLAYVRAYVSMPHYSSLPVLFHQGEIPPATLYVMSACLDELPDASKLCLDSATPGPAPEPPTPLCVHVILHMILSVAEDRLRQRFFSGKK